ncbi:FprA family A-type flavoprotein [uncultured Faecalibaculum sp.]|uniref:FprA family A-type flavoprotein n=1 Tax=uncultured Faecalibaculum sp. TaxID=1729681 RepID=UPI0027121C80|nr:FprA family A-type flavoprotein [uncultured Faecalibaculum sp.]
MKQLINDAIAYIGADDPSLDLFESQYKVPNGVAYNSYVVKGNDKTVIMDTIDSRKTGEWLAKMEEALDGRTPDYLVVSHLEPDHAANIGLLAEKYPDMKIIGNATTFRMLPNYFTIDNLADRKVEVKEGDEIDLGGRHLKFVFAPMVHWPEVMMTYVPEDKVLFSADGFGKFGTLDCMEEWEPEAARYYFNIMGKYGPQVQAILKKAAGLEIETICPLHGPVLKEDLGKYIGLYDKWSRYEPDQNAILIACACAYGGTFQACEYLKDVLENMGQNVILRDLTRQDVHQVMAEAFRCPKTVLASSTYNMGMFPPMETLLNTLEHKAWQKRTVGIVENGSWSPAAAKAIKAELAGMKDITVLEPVVTIKGRMKEEDKAKLAALAEQLVKA